MKKAAVIDALAALGVALHAALSARAVESSTAPAQAQAIVPNR